MRRVKFHVDGEWNKKCTQVNVINELISVADGSARKRMWKENEDRQNASRSAPYF